MRIRDMRESAMECEMRYKPGYKHPNEMFGDYRLGRIARSIA